MPKRTDLKKIMIIGSGPIVIGQAAEFDYAGTQIPDFFCGRYDFFHRIRYFGRNRRFSDFNAKFLKSFAVFRVFNTFAARSEKNQSGREVIFW